MSIAGEGQSGKIGSLVEMTRDLAVMAERAAVQGATLHELERAAFDKLLEMGRVVIDEFLALQGDGNLGETVTTDEGQTLHRSSESVARPLRTIFGQHKFSAFVYRERTHPNTPIVFRPIDTRMSLPPGRWSHLLEEFTQLFCIEQAFEPAAEAFERIFRQRLSVDTLERANQRMGAQAEEFLNSLAVPPAAKEGELLVVTSDGKGVPMVQADALRLRCFEERPTRPGNRRMATLAGVYSVDRHVRTPEQIVAALFRDVREEPAPSDDARPEPRHKRIIARFPQLFEELDAKQPISGSIIALSWAACDVEQRRCPGQRLVCLMDGQPSLWDTADVCLDGVPKEMRIDILDIIHVAGYLWRAAKAFHSHRKDQEPFVRQRLLRILQGDVQGVISGLRRMATLRQLGGDPRQEIDTVCGYFTTHVHRMRYDEYLAAGCPIATGVIEGACRHLVKDRMERSGMRWTKAHAQAMLDVRAIHQSSYWDEFHQQRIQNDQESSRQYRNLLERITTLAG